MNKIEHIGIAVADLDAANKLYTTLLNTSPYKQEVVESEGVVTSFFKMGETKIELLAATHDDSPIAKFIQKKGEGIHHIAFDVSDIEAEIERLQAEGFELIHKVPKPGADGKRIAFLHPKSTGYVLVELCEGI
jgi:methylmalonyl-CoA/ethylmalonyl-CoA epimerase